MFKQLAWKPSSPSSKVEDQTQVVGDLAQTLQNRAEKVKHRAEEIEKLAQIPGYSTKVDQLRRVRADWYRAKADRLHQRRTFLILREERGRITAWDQIQEEKKAGKHLTVCSDSICTDGTWAVLEILLNFLEARTQVVGNYFAYVAAYDNSISVIDIDGHVMIDTIDIIAAKVIAITPNGNQAYVSTNERPTIFVIDTDINRVIGHIRMDRDAHAEDRIVGIAFTPDGNRAYAVMELRLQKENVRTVIVVVISTDSRSVIATIETRRENIPRAVHSKGIAISPDGKKVYVLSEVFFHVNCLISVISTDSHTVIATIPLSSFPELDLHRIAITPNGDWAYVTDRFNKGIFVIDMNSHQVTATISLEGIPVEIVITPDGAWAYVTLNVGKFVVIDINSHMVINVIKGEKREKGISIEGSHDYAYIYSIGSHKVIDVTSIRRYPTFEIGQLTWQ
jgi:YVTN family beta-propeller protein